MRKSDISLQRGKNKAHGFRTLTYFAWLDKLPPRIGSEFCQRHRYHQQCLHFHRLHSSWNKLQLRRCQHHLLTKRAERKNPMCQCVYVPPASITNYLIGRRTFHESTSANFPAFRRVLSPFLIGPNGCFVGKPLTLS